MLIQPVEHIQIDTIIAYYSEKCLFKSEVIGELIWECAINEILEFQSTFISRNRAQARKNEGEELQTDYQLGWAIFMP